MPNPYYQAKHLWESNQKQAGFSLINDYLEHKLNQRVFIPWPDRFKSPYHARFESLITTLMGSADDLVAPFARVYPHLWALYPTFGILLSLKNQDVLTTPDIPDYLLEYEEGIIDPVTTMEDLRATADALITSARKGILNPVPNDRSSNGRVALPLADVQQIPDQQWGPLKKMLLQGLPAAFEACPDHFWQILALEEPEEVVVRFLDEVFAHYGPWHTSLMRVEMIIRHHLEYAQAIESSIETLLSESDDSSITEIVQLVGTQSHVQDGKQWLSLIGHALKQKNVEPLRNLGGEQVW